MRFSARPPIPCATTLKDQNRLTTPIGDARIPSAVSDRAGGDRAHRCLGSGVHRLVSAPSGAV